MLFKRQRQALDHAEQKGKQINAARREYISKINATKKNIEELNKVLDDGITFKIKSAMGGKNAK